MNFLDWLQVLSPLLTLAFGVYGLGAQLRDSSGHLTRKGFGVLTGVVVGGIVSVASSWWQLHAKTASAKEASERAIALLETVERATFASRDARMSARVTIDLKRAGLEDFDALLRAVDKTKSRICLHRVANGNEKCTGYEIEGDALFFDRDSVLYLSRTQLKAHDYLEGLGVWVHIGNMGDTNPAAPNTTSYQRSFAAFVMDFDKGINFEYRSSKLTAIFSDVPLSNLPSRNEKVGSILEMLGRRVYAEGTFDPDCIDANYQEDKACISPADTIRDTVSIDSVSIDFPHNVNVHLSSNGSVGETHIISETVDANIKNLISTY